MHQQSKSLEFIIAAYQGIIRLLCERAAENPTNHDLIELHERYGALLLKYTRAYFALSKIPAPEALMSEDMAIACDLASAFMISFMNRIGEPLRVLLRGAVISLNHEQCEMNLAVPNESLAEVKQHQSDMEEALRAIASTNYTLNIVRQQASEGN